MEEQLTLGQLIDKIEELGTTNNVPVLDGDDIVEPKCVQFDFGTAIPTSLHSWRGVYSQLALGYELTGYDNHETHLKEISADDLLKELKSAVGKSFEGWKGGNYRMNRDTPVWVSNQGNGSDTRIVDVIDKEYKLVIITKYDPY